MGIGEEENTGRKVIVLPQGLQIPRRIVIQSMVFVMSLFLSQP